MRETVMQLIEQTRKKYHVSQEQFARDVSKALAPFGDISTSTIRNWEKGRTIPDYFTLFYLSQQDTWLQEFAAEAMAIIKKDLKKPN